MKRGKNLQNISMEKETPKIYREKLCINLKQKIGTVRDKNAPNTKTFERVVCPSVHFITPYICHYPLPLSFLVFVTTHFITPVFVTTPFITLYHILATPTNGSCSRFSLCQFQPKRCWWLLSKVIS